MRTYLYTFTHAGHTVDYRIMARNKHVANRFARRQERAWRATLAARQEGRS
jgi:hypothetical protein